MPSEDQDEKGVASRRGSKAGRAVRWLAARWSTWVPIVLSLLALLVAVDSNRISARNSEVSRKLAKLEFRPRIKLRAFLRSRGRHPPHIVLENVGPIDATRLTVKMYSHRSPTGRWNAYISSTLPGLDVQVERLHPHDSRAFALDEVELKTNARLGWPEHTSVLEMRLSYRRPQDLKEYVESAFYFVNPDGRWVSERDGSVDAEAYEAMKSAILGHVTRARAPIYQDWGGDILHPQDTEDYEGGDP